MNNLYKQNDSILTDNDLMCLKIIEYNLNGVEEVKEIKSGEEINIKKQNFKSFLINNGLSE